MATHSSVLAWRIPWTEEPGRLWSTGPQRVRYDGSSLARAHTALVKSAHYSGCVSVSPAVTTYIHLIWLWSL